MDQKDKKYAQMEYEIYQKIKEINYTNGFVKVSYI
jgi:hypothetical protein